MTSETEKITLNISPVDLGRVDLLVEEGFYSTRSDFIRMAIRNLLAQHGDHVQDAVTRRAMVIGVVGYNRRDLARLLERGETVEIHAVGVLHIADDVTPELALSTIRSAKVLGSLQASAIVRAALAEAGRLR